MLVCIISDSHDNITRIDQVLFFIKQKKIKTIIHCGDVATLETLKYLSENFNGKIYLSLGNVDEMHGLEKKYNPPTGRQVNLKNITVFEKFGELKIDNINISFCHFPCLSKELANTKKYDFVFYGHTHKPWEEKIKDKNNPSTNSGSLINPGTLAGMFNKSTFAILDTETKKIELKIL